MDSRDLKQYLSHVAIVTLIDGVEVPLFIVAMRLFLVSTTSSHKVALTAS